LEASRRRRPNAADDARRAGTQRGSSVRRLRRRGRDHRSTTATRFPPTSGLLAVPEPASRRGVERRVFGVKAETSAGGPRARPGVETPGGVPPRRVHVGHSPSPGSPRCCSDRLAPVVSASSRTRGGTLAKDLGAANQARSRSRGRAGLGEASSRLDGPSERRGGSFMKRRGVPIAEAGPQNPPGRAPAVADPRSRRYRSPGGEGSAAGGTPA